MRVSANKLLIDKSNQNFYGLQSTVKFDCEHGLIIDHEDHESRWMVKEIINDYDGWILESNDYIGWRLIILNI